MLAEEHFLRIASVLATEFLPRNASTVSTRGRSGHAEYVTITRYMLQTCGVVVTWRFSPIRLQETGLN